VRFFRDGWVVLYARFVDAETADVIVMSGESPSLWSRLKKWTFIFAMIVLVYLLTLPVVSLCVMTGWPLSTSYAKRGAKPKGWVRSYRVPYDWLAGKSFAKATMKRYEAWCAEVMIPRKKGEGIW
jgi:hypothetical protein